MRNKNSSAYNYRRPHSGGSMAGERLLVLIEKYIALDLIMMLIGLLHESHGMRGYPFAWSGNGRVDAFAFGASLAVITLIIIAGDVITRIIIRASEPVTNVQKTLDKYSSTYSEYEDPYVTDVRQNYVNASDTKHAEEKGHGTSLPKISARISGYEESIEGDYKKIQKLVTRRSVSSVDKHDDNNTVQVSKLLNGRNPSDSNDKKKTSGSIAAIIALIAFGLVSCISVFDFDDIDYVDDGSLEEIAIDEGSTAMDQCDYIITSLTNSDSEELEERFGSDAEAVISAIDWENADWYYMNSEFETPDDLNSYAVLTYRVYSEDHDCIVVFKFSNNGDGSNLAEDESSAELTGIAVCPYPDEGSYDLSDFGEMSFEDFASSLNDDEREELRDSLIENTATAGDVILDDEFIFLR